MYFTYFFQYKYYLRICRFVRILYGLDWKKKITPIIKRNGNMICVRRIKILSAKNDMRIERIRVFDIVTTKCVKDMILAYIHEYMYCMYFFVWQRWLIIFALGKRKLRSTSDCAVITGIILCMRRANYRRRYSVTSSLIGWTHAENDLCHCIT